MLLLLVMLALLLLLLLVLILLVLLPLEERLVSGNMACTFSTLRCRPPHEFLCRSARCLQCWGSAQCTFVSVSVCLPVRVAAAPVYPFRSLAIDFVDSSVDLPFFCRYSCDFSSFSFALLFRIRFSSYFTIYTLRLLVNSRHFRYIVFDFSNAFYIPHSTSHIRPPQTCRLIFYFQFFIFISFSSFFCNFALLAKQFSHANFKWNRIQLLLLLLSRRGARDRKVEATENDDDDRRWRTGKELTLRELWTTFRYWTWAQNEQSRTSVRAQLYNETLQRQSSLPVFIVLALALSCVLSLAPLSTDMRSLWAALHALSALLSGLISSLSRISFSFSICVEKFIHALLCECECDCCLCL